MNAYLDSSVILRKLLDEKDPVKDWNRWGRGATSELAMIESLRALDRLRLQGDIQDAEVSEKRKALLEMFELLSVISLDREILDRAAEPFPTILATLDAIHLASALLYRAERKGDLTFLTHDLQLGTAAQAMGFEVHGIRLS